MSILQLVPRPVDRPLRLLAIGAHADDIEIGCGGTLLHLLSEYPGAELRYVVFSATPERELEARRAASELGAKKIDIHHFRDGYLPWSEPVEVKQTMAALRAEIDPDIVFTHRRDDLHQDHAFVANLTWQSFRDHLIFEYEIPKYEGDLGHPNIYVPLQEAEARQKVELTLRHFATQSSKAWFRAETFEATMRLRAVECNSPTGWAEAFCGRKISLSFR